MIARWPGSVPSGVTSDTGETIDMTERYPDRTKAMLAQLDAILNRTALVQPERLGRTAARRMLTS